MRHNWRGSIRPARSFLLWGGVRIVSQTLRLLEASLNLLEEASADLTEWILHDRWVAGSKGKTGVFYLACTLISS